MNVSVQTLFLEEMFLCKTIFRANFMLLGNFFPILIFRKVMSNPQVVPCQEIVLKNMICTSLHTAKYFYEVSLKLAHEILRNG